MRVAEYIERFRKPGEAENPNYGMLFRTLRYLSFYMAIPFVHLPVTPNQITFFMHFLQAAGMSLVAILPGYYRLIGIFMFFVGGIFDFVDGNIARYKGMTSKKGVFYDQIGHVVVGPIYFAALAIAGYQDTAQVEYLYLAVLLAMMVPISSFQTCVSPQYFEQKDGVEQVGRNQASDETSSQRIGRKIFAYIYAFKIEIVALGIVFDVLNYVAIFYGAYFVFRFIVQLYLDQKRIN